MLFTQVLAEPTNNIASRLYFSDSRRDENDLLRHQSNSPPVESDMTSNGLVIGVILGACAVLFIVCLIFLVYKIYRKRKRQEKYHHQSPSHTASVRTGSGGANDPVSQVTLLPISPHHRQTNHYVSSQQIDRMTSQQMTSCSSNSDLRPPPSYNESFLDNGGPVVAV